MQEVELGTKEGIARAWTEQHAVCRRSSVGIRQRFLRCGAARGSPNQSEGATVYASNQRTAAELPKTQDMV